MVKMKLNLKSFRQINRGVSHYNIGFEHIEEVIDFPMGFFSWQIRFEVVIEFQIFHIFQRLEIGCSKNILKAFRNFVIFHCARNI